MMVGGVMVSWWLQFLLVCLVLLGGGMVARWLWQGFWWSVWHVRWGQVRWWLRDRVIPLLERPEGILCAGCAGDSHCGGVEGGCDCTCGWPEDWAGPLEELPPERTWEEMTSHQLPLERSGRGSLRGQIIDNGSDLFPPERERRLPEYEAEARAHYVAMGFDYPSGLMARVRESAL